MITLGFKFHGIIQQLHSSMLVAIVFFTFSNQLQSNIRFISKFVGSKARFSLFSRPSFDTSQSSDSCEARKAKLN